MKQPVPKLDGGLAMACRLCVAERRPVADLRVLVDRAGLRLQVWCIVHDCNVGLFAIDATAAATTQLHNRIAGHESRCSCSVCALRQNLPALARAATDIAMGRVQVAKQHMSGMHQDGLTGLTLLLIDDGVFERVVQPALAASSEGAKWFDLDRLEGQG